MIEKIFDIFLTIGGILFMSLLVYQCNHPLTCEQQGLKTIEFKVGDDLLGASGTYCG